MCFLLFIGADRPLPVTAFDDSNRRVHVTEVTDVESAIRQHFDRAAVQCIGSSLGCGCGFRNVCAPGDPHFADEDNDNEHEQNHQQLVDLLSAVLGDRDTVELLGCWGGDESNPIVAEYEVPLGRLNESDFAFVESARYRLRAG